MSSQADRRRHVRTVCSVLSSLSRRQEATGRPRHIGPGVVTDLSESGLALAVDNAPTIEDLLVIDNAYFEAEAVVRNVVKTDTGFRAGVEFTGPIRWKIDLDADFVDGVEQQDPAAKRTAQTLKVAPVPRPPTRDRFQTYLAFLKALERARDRLSNTLKQTLIRVELDLSRRKPAASTEISNTPEPRWACLKCARVARAAKVLNNEMEILLPFCRNCLVQMAGSAAIAPDVVDASARAYERIRVLNDVRTERELPRELVSQ